VLLAEGGRVGRQRGVVMEENLWLNTRSNIEVVKPQTFNKKVEKISRFFTAYKLFIKMRIREMVVEEQI